jgi:tetratricopeptide (TPR) repeat protein
VEDRPEGEAPEPGGDAPRDEKPETAQKSGRDRGRDRDRGDASGGESRADRTLALRKLVELAAKHGEIGPPLAELCFAIGESEVGNQLVRLGTQGGASGVEYWFVAANAARRQRRYQDAIRATVEAIQALAAQPDAPLGPDGESRFLHLIRIGFATLMFDLRDLNADPEFSKALAEGLPKLESRMGTSPFFRSLMAQTHWFTDKEASEKEWDRADELGDPETTWNARGTWYHEAEQDLDKSERAYRRGLEKVPTSALLMHNLAQILVEKAKRPGVSPDEARRRLNQATELLRSALRQDAPRLRRHIHATRDRLEELRRTLPAPPPRPDRGPPRDRDRFARDRGPGPGGGDRPQSHDRGPDRDHRGPDRDQRAHDRDHRPPDREQHRPPDRNDRGPRRPRESQPQPKQKFLVEGTVSLGEMILAKLKEQQEKG